MDSTQAPKRGYSAILRVYLATCFAINAVSLTIWLLK